MSMNNDPFYTQLKKIAETQYPHLSETTRPVAYTHLFSPCVIDLPKSIFETASQAVKAFYDLRYLPDYQKSIELPDAEIMQSPAKNDSVLMAYDFHSDNDGNLSLIEINTNASGFLIADLLYQAHGLTPMVDSKPLNSLISSFANEYQLCHGSSQALKKIAIIDEKPREQKMYLEFLMYKSLFEKQGWNPSIHDQSELTLNQDRVLQTSEGEPIDLVYNRSTDFLLQNPDCKNLREAYIKGTGCFSPHPKEYVYLADKQRLIEMSQPGWLEKTGLALEKIEAIRKVLVPTLEMQSAGDPEEIWAKRKKMFFKPKRAYGGKSAYRGSSISRKHFERLLQEEVLVQEFRPAQKIEFQQQKDWKFDLRFYVYQNKIQLSVARLYKGQLTNFATENGGFAAIQFKTK